MDLDRRVEAAIDPLDVYKAPKTAGVLLGLLVTGASVAAAAALSQPGAGAPILQGAIVLAGLVLAGIVFRKVSLRRVAVHDAYLVVDGEMFRWSEIESVRERRVSVQASVRSGGGEIDSYFRHRIAVVENGRRRVVRLPRVNGSDGLRTAIARKISDDAFSKSEFADWIDRD